MKWNQTLLKIAIGYSVINILFYTHILNLNGGSSLIYVLIYPLFWLLTIIIISALTYKKRKSWLSKQLKVSTIILLVFCTPLPLLICSSLIQSDIYRSSTSYNSKNGKITKIETWDYTNGKTAIKKFWKNENIKDSLWIYFDKNGDTLKTEIYKNNQLLKIKEYNKNIR